MIPDFATLLRPAKDRGETENLEFVDFARSFACTQCPTGVRLGRGVGLTPCGDCGANVSSEKITKVEEHLRNYIEQLEEVISEASDLEIPSLEENVCADPAGLSLLSQDHYLCLRLILGRAKFYLRIKDHAKAGQLWDVFFSRAIRLCTKLRK